MSSLIPASTAFIVNISPVYSFLFCFQVSVFIYFNFLEMNIFVSNLSYGVNSDDLGQIFQEYGEVSSAKVIMDRETGRSRGFGFVEMSDADGQKAIDGLNNAEYDGKVISVSVARPKTEGAGGGRSFGGGGNRGGGGYGGGGNRRSY